MKKVPFNSDAFGKSHDTWDESIVNEKSDNETLSETSGDSENEYQSAPESSTSSSDDNVIRTKSGRVVKKPMFYGLFN